MTAALYAAPLGKRLGSLAWEGMDSLVERGVVRTYGAGEHVGRSEVVDELHLVLEGEVALACRSDEEEIVAVALAGDALEVEALFTGASNWRFNWVCRKLTRVASVPRALLQRLAVVQPVQYRYMERLACHPELATLRDDLRLFGQSDEVVRGVIASLSYRDIHSEHDLFPARPQFGVLGRGWIDVHAGAGEARRLVHRYCVGDPFVVVQSGDVTLEAAPGTSVWLISYDELIALSGEQSHGIDRFMSFVALGVQVAPTAKDAPEAPEHPPDPRKSSPPSDDGGPEMGCFMADAMTLRKLHARRRPFVQQHDEMDCGAACMSMIAAFFGRRISVPKMRSVVHVTRSGASLYSIKKAAEHIGFDAIGIRTPYQTLTQCLVPFIALTGYHFVVVYEVTRSEVVVGDPSRGIVRMPAPAFLEEWSGIVILLKPTPRLHQFPESTTHYSKYLSLLHGLRRPTLEAVLASLLLFISGLSQPLFMQAIFDQVLPGGQRGLLEVVAVSMFAIAILAQLTGWARDYLIIYVASHADAKFASLFLQHVLDLPLEFFAVRRVGAITARLRELTRIRQFITRQTIAIVMNAFSALVYSAVLGSYHPLLLLIVGFALPLAVTFMHSASPRLKATLQESFKVLARSNGMAFEHFSAFETIKSINGLLAARWRWLANHTKLLRLRQESTRLVALTSSASELLIGSTEVAVLVASVWFYTRHELTLGQVVASNILVSNIAAPVVALVGQWNGIQQLGVAFSRIDDVISSPSERGGDVETTLGGRIQFESVEFHYGSELSPRVLNGVTLEIRPGETVAFVGESGSGKTTLAHMVSCLYSPTKGRVLLDGLDARTLSLSSVRSQVAMVTQDNSLFSGSILENIALGDPSPSFERVLAAAKTADAHEFINRLPERYSTRLGEGGTGLSGGQRQRINIARALYKDPVILILDEATSSLDAVSERTIMDRLGSGASRRTTVMIAHRLNTILNASRIFVFDEGRLIESGTHAQLLDIRGRYYRLYSSQLSTPANTV